MFHVFRAGFVDSVRGGARIATKSGKATLSLRESGTRMVRDRPNSQHRVRLLVRELGSPHVRPSAILPVQNTIDALHLVNSHSSEDTW